MLLQDLVESAFDWSDWENIRALFILLYFTGLKVKITFKDGSVEEGHFNTIYAVPIPSIELKGSKIGNDDNFTIHIRDISKIALVHNTAAAAKLITKQLLDGIKRHGLHFLQSEGPIALKRVIPVAKELGVLTPDLQKIIRYSQHENQ